MMNWKVLVNILLIVLLLHFIIKNLQYASDNGHTGIELFTDAQKIKQIEDRKLPEPGPPLVKLPPKVGDDDDGDKPVQTVNMDKEHFNAIKFLTTPETNYDNTFYLNQETDRVKQANVYTNDWNSANFQSNVLDVRNFYNVSNPAIPTPHRDLELKNEETVEQIADQACFSKEATSQTAGPEIWKYKNELPMNGGSFLNGVYGFNSEDNLFATFTGNDKLTNKDCGPDNRCRGQQDDIRSGVGIPSQKWWRSN